ncbi:phosphatase 2C 29-like protein [Tanacetum coccineum]
MGASFSCFTPGTTKHRREPPPDILFTSSEPLDETLGHSFCYVRSSNRFVSPSNSDRFLSPSNSLRFGGETGGFKAISGASVSANSFTPKTVNIYDDPCKASLVVSGFESTSSFSALPLQPVPRGEGETERGYFMSGPIERGAMSGPLEAGMELGSSNRVGFSAPLNAGMYAKKKRNKAFFNRPWVVPVRNFVGSRKADTGRGGRHEELDVRNESDVQWALGKAGEDRVHVVVSEEHGWLFVGIYDGFNGPDAPEFLMGNLYKATYKELEGLFWDNEDVSDVSTLAQSRQQVEEEVPKDVGGSMKKVTFETGSEIETRRRKRLWEYLAQEEPEDGLDLSGSERFAFSVDDAVNISKTTPGVSRRSLLLSKLKNGFTKNKDGGKLFAWKFGLDAKEHKDVENRIEERTNAGRSGSMKKVGPVDHELVLRAMSRALEVTEHAYLDMTDKVMDQYPELALMGSCLLVALMRDEDVYVMNLGDSRAIVAQHEEPQEVGSSGTGDSGLVVEGIIETNDVLGVDNVHDVPAHDMKLMALQLSTDHSTSIEEVSREFSLDLNKLHNLMLFILSQSLAVDSFPNRKGKNSVEILHLHQFEATFSNPLLSCENKKEHPDDKPMYVNGEVKGQSQGYSALGWDFTNSVSYSVGLYCSSLFASLAIGSMSVFAAWYEHAFKSRWLDKVVLAKIATLLLSVAIALLLMKLKFLTFIPKWNDSLLEMFRNEYIGTAPYVSCQPSLRHHHLCPRDQFLVLSSDGLYQYFSNQEVVSHVEIFMEKFPDGDPAQHLIEELLLRAAKKAGMELHELLDIPQGDRRKYHDDVTVMIISLEGRIWKSSGKYL